jgi:hypothetical protein
VTAGKNSTSHSSDRTIPEAKKSMGRGTFMFAFQTGDGLAFIKLLGLKKLPPWVAFESS